MSIRVFVVDDHMLFRSGVRSGFGDDITLVGEAWDLPSAVSCILETSPDVVLIDVHMPGGGGRDVIEQARKEGNASAFLALSVSDDPADVIAMIRAGARGYATKTVSPEELTDAIRTVAAGDAWFSPRLAGFVLDAFQGGRSSGLQSDLDQLSPREQEVLRHIARGYTYKEAAKALFISVKTIETHVSAVLRKLQLTNRHELTRWAEDKRIV